MHIEIKTVKIGDSILSLKKSLAVLDRLSSDTEHVFEFFDNDFPYMKVKSKTYDEAVKMFTNEIKIIAEKYLETIIELCEVNGTCYSKQSLCSNVAMSSRSKLSKTSNVHTEFLVIEHVCATNIKRTNKYIISITNNIHQKSNIEISDSGIVLSDKFFSIFTNVDELEELCQMITDMSKKPLKTR